MNKGYLFYVIGSSGVGKDSILNELKQKINSDHKILFAQRFITRPFDEGNEQHIFLSKEDFLHKKKLNLFALDWEAHDNLYGIGIEIDTWMENGFHIIVNGSRGYLEAAKEKYPNLKSILIDADQSIIYERLMGRKRESVELIEKRIQRNEQFHDLQYDLIIENVSTIENAVDAFLGYINQLKAQ